MRLPFVLTLVLTASLALFATAISANPIKVWVELTDKGPLVATQPAGTMQASSQQNRVYEDQPVYQPYLQRLAQAGFTTDIALKWQNRVSGWIDSAKLPDLNRLSMVRRVEGFPRKAPYSHLPVSGLKNGLGKTAVQNSVNAISFGAFQTVFDTTQASVLRATLSTKNQTAGQGMKVAIIDADFDLGDTAFAHLFQANQIVDQWDFVAGKSTIVKDSLGDSHGAATLSLLGGKSSSLEGLVPNAKFLLYRSENVATETYVEEDYVAAAIERAVDSGAQVISISLGYRYGYTDGSPDLPYSSMNGRTRPSSVAALGAARRNVLVSVAMGNEGPTTSAGPTISAPADADSILSAGILDINLNPCSYTSTGPTYDHRVKPDIASIGPVNCTTPTVDPTTTSGVAYQGGTSFAAPVIAGIGTLLRQLHPAASVQSIRSALIATAGKFSHPDSASGYGLVRAAKADSILSIPTGLVEKNIRATVPWRIGFDPAGARLRDLNGRKVSSKVVGTPIFILP